MFELFGPLCPRRSDIFLAASCGGELRHATEIKGEFETHRKRYKEKRMLKKIKVRQLKRGGGIVVKLCYRTLKKGIQAELKKWGFSSEAYKFRDMHKRIFAKSPCTFYCHYST